MKRLALFISFIVLFVSCATGRYVDMQDPQVQFDAGEILYTQHPELMQFYDEGVLKITTMKEIRRDDGRNDYKINYRFVKYYYRDYAEMLECLRTRFPAAYEMYKDGFIDVYSLYKYVDTRTMEIKYRLSYRKIYNVYYDVYYDNPFYPYVRYRHRYGPIPVPSRRMSPPPVSHGQGMNPRPSQPRGGGQAPQATPRGNSQTPQQPSRGSQGGSRRR